MEQWLHKGNKEKNSLVTTHCSDTTQGSHIDLPLACWSNSKIFTWPYPLAFLCHLSSSATLTWPPWFLCPTSEDFYGSDTGLCNHWAFALEPTPSFYVIHFINWWAKCLFPFSQDCSFLSQTLWVSRTVSASGWCALQEALCKCIDTVQYNDIKEWCKKDLYSLTIYLYETENCGNNRRN